MEAPNSDTPLTPPAFPNSVANGTTSSSRSPSEAKTYDGASRASLADRYDEVEAWKQSAREMCSALGYEFENKELLYRALDRTYRSKKGKDDLPDHEHMEFVGDAVVGLVVKLTLSSQDATASPFELTKASERFLRNADASAEHGSPMYRIAKKLNLESRLRTNSETLDRYGYRGKSTSIYKKTREHLLTDHVEAIFGALVIDCQYEVSKVWPIIEQLMHGAGLNGSRDDVSTFGASTLGDEADIGDSASVLLRTPAEGKGYAASSLSPIQSAASEESDWRTLVVKAAEKGHVHLFQPEGRFSASELDPFTLYDALGASVRGGKSNIFALLLRAAEPKLGIDELKSLRGRLPDTLTKEMVNSLEKLFRKKRNLSD